MTLRKALLNLHLWVGLAAALFVAFLAATGTMLVFEGEIDRTLNPSLLTVPPAATNLPIAQLVDSAKKAFDGRPILNIGVNQRPDLAWQLIVAGKQITFAFINPHTGQITGSRARDASFMFKVHQLHTNLLVGKKGEKFVGYGTLCLLFLMLTGLTLWWKRKTLAIHTAGSWLRVNFDLHHISGLYSAFFLFVVVGTGLLMAFPDALYPVVEKFTGTTVREQPDDRPASTPLQGARGITPDSAVSIAQRQLAGARPTFVGLPMGPAGVYDVAFKYPDDQTPGGRSHVTIDRYSGEVLWLESSHVAPRGVKFANKVRPLHTGDIYRWPSRILFAIASFSVVVQACTGIIIWGVRFFRSSKIAQHFEAVRDAE